MFILNVFIGTAAVRRRGVFNNKWHHWKFQSIRAFTLWSHYYWQSKFYVCLDSSCRVVILMCVAAAATLTFGWENITKMFNNHPPYSTTQCESLSETNECGKYARITAFYRTRSVQWYNKNMRHSHNKPLAIKSKIYEYFPIIQKCFAAGARL